MAPKLIVVPAFAPVVPIMLAIAIVATTSWTSAKESARARAAEAALDEALMSNAKVNEALFRCEAGHARIVDRIEALRSEW